MSSVISPDDLPRRRPRPADALEEGDCGAPVEEGYHSSSDTEDYYNRDVALSAESDDTVSDLDATATSAAAARDHKTNTSASSAAAPNHSKRYSAAANHYYDRARALSAAASRICGKEFASEKAVCGNMKIHAQEAARGGCGKDKKQAKKRGWVEVAAGWGVTGKRGCSGLVTSVDMVIKDSPPSAQPDRSVTDTVPEAEPKVVDQATPISFAMPENSPPATAEAARTCLSGESSSKKPKHDDDMDIAEAGGANPIPIPVPAAEDDVAQQQAPPPPAGEQQARPVNRKSHAGMQNPDGYWCSDPTCRMWFGKFQALGGHIAAHKNKRMRLLQDGPAPCGGGSKQEKKRHECKKCPAVFALGVQLGGHMRKHYEGEPIVPKRRLRLNLAQPLPPPADVAAVHRPADVQVDGLTRSPPIKAESQSSAQPQPAPAAAAEGTPEPAPGARVTGPVILFGVVIGLGVKTTQAQEASPATKDPSASTAEQEQQ
jgi:hypothetical protein